MLSRLLKFTALFLFFAIANVYSQWEDKSDTADLSTYYFGKNLTHFFKRSSDTCLLDNAPPDWVSGFIYLEGGPDGMWEEYSILPVIIHNNKERVFDFYTQIVSGEPSKIRFEAIAISEENETFQIASYTGAGFEKEKRTVNWPKELKNYSKAKFRIYFSYEGKVEVILHLHFQNVLPVKKKEE